MGKSTAAAALRRLGVPVHDSDAVVHRLMAPGGAAVAPVEAAFPGVVARGAVDRAALGAKVFADPAALRRLEAILHPLVRRSARAFVARMTRRRRPIVVLDIPLLYETGGEALCDAIMVVSAPGFVQRARVLARPAMTDVRLAAILAQQMLDADKRRRADFVIDTGLTRRNALRRIEAALSNLGRRRGDCRSCQDRPNADLYEDLS